MAQRGLIREVRPRMCVERFMSRSALVSREVCLCPNKVLSAFSGVSVSRSV